MNRVITTDNQTKVENNQDPKLAVCVTLWHGVASSDLPMKYIQISGYIKLLICARKYVKVQETSQK